MYSCSVKLAFSDDEIYENFIEPRKINGELPDLVLRLLTAYAMNADLAVEIDQYIDEMENPEVMETRSCILNALAHLNAAESIATQATEAMSSADAQDDDSEYVSLNLEKGTAIESQDEEIPDNVPRSPFNFGVSAQPVQEPTVNAQASVADSQIIIETMGTLTQQVALLADSVERVVDKLETWGTTASVSPVEASAVSNTSQQLNTSISTTPMNTEGLSMSSEISAVSESSVPVVPINPTVDTVVEKSVETVENISSEPDDDTVSVPDFMFGMIDSIS